MCIQSMPQFLLTKYILLISATTQVPVVVYVQRRFPRIIICEYMTTKIKNSTNALATIHQLLSFLLVHFHASLLPFFPWCIMSQIHYLPQPLIHLTFSFFFALLLMQIIFLFVRDERKNNGIV